MQRSFASLWKLELPLLLALLLLDWRSTLVNDERTKTHNLEINKRFSLFFLFISNKLLDTTIYYYYTTTTMHTYYYFVRIIKKVIATCVRIRGIKFNISSEIQNDENFILTLEFRCNFNYWIGKIHRNPSLV